MSLDVDQKGFGFALRFLAGMAKDPLRSMREMGIEQASAVMMSMSPARTGRRLLYLTGGDNVRPIYNDTSTFISSNVPMRSRGQGAQARLRRGLIGARGTEHQHYRSSFVAQTGKSMMASFALDVARHADNWLSSLPTDEPVDLVGKISDLVRYYAVAMMFKDENPERAIEIGRQITAWIELGYQASNFILPFDLAGLPHARYLRVSEKLEQDILGWATERRGMSAKRDILSMFVNGPDENGKPLADDRLSGHILTIYAAAFTSSVASLIWAIFLLSQHPSIAYDLCDEISGSGINPLADGLAFLELPLLDRVLKESMRLFTPVPYQVRRVTRDIKVIGTDLKEKDLILIGAWATNRLSSVYINADRFTPDRWIDRDANTYDYLTFSAGPRRCVGYGLAQIMVKITLAMILLKRRPSLATNMRINTKIAVTLRAKQPIPMIFGDAKTSIVPKIVSGTVTNCYLS